MTACRSDGGARRAPKARRAGSTAATLAALAIAATATLTAAGAAQAQTRGPIQLAPPSAAPAAPGEAVPAPTLSVPAFPAPLPGALPAVARPASPAPRTTADGSIRIEGLARLTVDAAGPLTPDGDGLRSDLWAGTPGPIAVRLLKLLPAAPDSLALRDLQRRLLLSAGPAPADLPAEGSLLAVRAQRLLAMGALDDLAALAALAPGRDDDPDMARVMSERALAAGDEATACRLHQAVAARSDHRYWIRLGTVCDLWRGDTAKAELGTRLLGELGDPDPLLQEFVQSAVAGHAGGPNQLANAEPWHLAAARIARVPIDPDVMSIASLPVLVALARGIGDPPFAARLAAAEAAERAGAVTADALIALYADVAVQVGRVEGALRAAEADPSPYARALLWRTAEATADPAQRARVIAKAFEIADGAASWRQTARLFAGPIRRLEAGPATESFAPAAVRALVAAGDGVSARPWLDWLERRADAGDGKAAATRRDIWVIARIGGGEILAPYREAAVSAWWDGLRDADPEGASNLGAAALTLMHALGAPIGPDAWRGLASAPSTNPYEAPTAAFRNGVTAGSEAGRVAETVALASAGFGEVPLEEIDPTAIALVVAGLRHLGLEDGARWLAGEAALAYGL